MDAWEVPCARREQRSNFQIKGGRRRYLGRAMTIEIGGNEICGEEIVGEDIGDVEIGGDEHDPPQRERLRRLTV